MKFPRVQIIQKFLRIILTDSRNINPSFKKNLKNITVNYIFGTCEYKGWVKQLGDWRDHITFNDKGEQTRSLNVKLFDGNILNNVRFKLFLPKQDIILMRFLEQTF